MIKKKKAISPMKKVSRTDPVSSRVVRKGLMEEVAFRSRVED